MLIYYTRAEKSAGATNTVVKSGERLQGLRLPFTMLQAPSKGGGRSIHYRPFSAKKNATLETILQRINVNCQG